jgi:hypothetical protein
VDFTDAAWQKLAILLNHLVLRLPVAIDEDMAQGILEASHILPGLHKFLAYPRSCFCY